MLGGQRKEGKKEAQRQPTSPLQDRFEQKALSRQRHRKAQARKLCGEVEELKSKCAGRDNVDFEKSTEDKLKKIEMLNTEF